MSWEQVVMVLLPSLIPSVLSVVVLATTKRIADDVKEELKEDLLAETRKVEARIMRLEDRMMGARK